MGLPKLSHFSTFPIALGCDCERANHEGEQPVTSGAIFLATICLAVLLCVLADVIDPLQHGSAAIQRWIAAQAKTTLRVLGKTTISTLLGVAVGFLLSAAFDTWKSYRLSRASLVHAERLSELELRSALQTIDYNLYYLGNELDLLTNNERFLIFSMPEITYSSTTYAIQSGSFDNGFRNMSIILFDISTIYATQNKYIQYRDNYKNSNQSNGGLIPNLKYMDSALQGSLLYARVRTQFALDQLRRRIAASDNQPR
jgi:hypothetical protein